VAEDRHETIGIYAFNDVFPQLLFLLLPNPNKSNQGSKSPPFLSTWSSLCPAVPAHPPVAIAGPEALVWH
jgi:hypothetical protein